MNSYRAAWKRKTGSFVAIARYSVILVAHVATMKRTAHIVLLAGVGKYHDEKDAPSWCRCPAPISWGSAY
jgi:hypothetical protein